MGVKQNSFWFDFFTLAVTISVLKVFEIWVGKHWHDFGLNSSLEEELLIFIKNVSEIPEFKELGLRVQKLIEKEVSPSKMKKKAPRAINVIFYLQMNRNSSLMPLRPSLMTTPCKTRTDEERQWKV